ncbi:prolyl oligopeptidase family serine peptidase [Flagellimonas nanhaiensis]|nr:prolyl oligopeptidase family serine peptidase [Allomuricauda nanhaiensis]
MYKCPPCASDCHDTIYNAPGICPVCEMALVEIKDNQFEGYSKKKVSIESKGISLNAAYYAPNNKNTLKGALVIVHGSAPSTYEDVSYYTKIGIKLGMAVLAYDKRGVGGSGGTYQSFTVEGSKNWFNLLASDVLAVISWLKEQPELENAKLGLLGGSQAGWIMPLAASKTKEVDFMIIGAGVAVSAGEEHFFSQLTGDGEENGISIQEAHKKLEGFQGEKGFDPTKILKQLRTSTLWFLGTNDPVIPVDATIEELERINNPNFEIVLLPHGDHNFRNTKTGEPYNLIGFIQPWLTESGIWNK